MIASARARVFAYVGACDMRKQMNGLSNLVREELEQDPLNGDLYLFRNRRGDMIKVLFFDHGGYCLLAKRLEKGTFRWQLDVTATQVEISQSELGALLKDAILIKRATAA